MSDAKKLQVELAKLRDETSGLQSAPFPSTSGGIFETSYFIPGGGGESDIYSFRVSPVSGESTVNVQAGSIYFLGNRQRVSHAATSSLAVANGSFVFIEIDFGSTAGISVDVKAGATIPGDASHLIHIPLAQVSVDNDVVSVAARFHIGSVILPFGVLGKEEDDVKRSVLTWDPVLGRYEIVECITDEEIE